MENIRSNDNNKCNSRFINYCGVIALLFITNCAGYKPVVDTAGRSGTFQESKAIEITNDLQHCKKIAEDNSSFWANQMHRWKYNTGESKYVYLYKKCMNNRGHSVVY